MLATHNRCLKLLRITTVQYFYAQLDSLCFQTPSTVVLIAHQFPPQNTVSSPLEKAFPVRPPCYFSPESLTPYKNIKLS